MKPILAMLLGLAVASHAQPTTYYIQGLLRQPSAALAQKYLQISPGAGSNGVAVAQGTNIILLTNASGSVVTINAKAPINGTNGAPGAPGAPGANGANGTNGTNGVNGIDGTNVLIWPNTVFVSPLGNDATAIRGRLDKAALTLSNALVMAHAYDTVFMFNGLYAQSNVNTLSNNITLMGESPEQTIILGVAFLALHTLNISGAATLQGVTLIGTNQNTPLNLTMAADTDRVTVRNIITLGNQDGIVTTGANTLTNLIIQGCFLDSYFDCFNLQSGVSNSSGYYMYGNRFRSRHVAGESNIQCVGRVARGTVCFLNSDLSATDGSSQTSDFNITGGNVRVSNCGMVATSVNGGTVAKLIISDGAIDFDGCSINATNISQTGGTITYQ